MIIDDQIRDETLQYHINREAAKILALLSGKSHKYEYLTGEKILPSNKQQIIEQANLLIVPCNYNDYNDKDSPLILKQKEIFNKLAKERFNKINELDKKVDIDDLVYRYRGKSPNEKFDKCDNALDLINKIRNGEIKFSIAKNDQIIFKSHLDEIKKRKQQKKIKRAKKHTIQY